MQINAYYCNIVASVAITAIDIDQNATDEYNGLTKQTTPSRHVKEARHEH